MGDNSIFIVFSNIWSSVHLKIPSIPTFSFYLFIAVLLVFLYLIAANKSVLLLYACAHKISLKSLSRKNCHWNMLLKMPGV